MCGSADDTRRTVRARIRRSLSPGRARGASGAGDLSPPAAWSRRPGIPGRELRSTVIMSGSSSNGLTRSLTRRRTVEPGPSARDSGPVAVEHGHVQLPVSVTGPSVTTVAAAGYDAHGHHDGGCQWPGWIRRRRRARVCAQRNLKTGTASRAVCPSPESDPAACEHWPRRRFRVSGLVSVQTTWRVGRAARLELAGTSFVTY